MDERTIETITRKVLERLGEEGGARSPDRVRLTPGGGDALRFPVGISARHVHLSRAHLDILFGTGYELEVLRMLKQPGQFAARETLTLVGPRRVLYGVRILGPTRSSTQVEISMTDCYHLGIKAPVRDSGNHEATPGAVLVGPAGCVRLERGVIVAARHLHVEPERAAAAGLHDGQRVSVAARGGQSRSLVFDNVLVRCGTAHLAEFHVDTDEANAAGLSGDSIVEVIPV